jgi:hypothetical protein
MFEVRIKTETPEMAAIIVAVLEELARAERKHPVWPTCHVKQIAIVAEEAGELIREGNLLDEEKSDFQKIKVEAIHTAATAIRFIKNIDSTERAYDQQGIIEYFTDDSPVSRFMLERDDHE